MSVSRRIRIQTVSVSGAGQGPPVDPEEVDIVFDTGSADAEHSLLKIDPLILGSQGTADADGSERLVLTLDLGDDAADAADAISETAMVSQDQGSADAAEPTLVIDPLILGDTDAVDSAEGTTLMHLWTYGERTATPAGFTAFTNPSNATGRPDDTSATTGTGGSDQGIDLRSGLHSIPTTGFTLLPDLTQVYCSVSTTGAASGAGESVTQAFRVGSGGTLRTFDTSPIVGGPFNYTITPNSLDPTRMISDDSNVQSDLEAVTDWDDLVDESLTRMTHVKAAAGGQRTIFFDGVGMSTWAYRGTSPTVDTIKDFNGADWNDDGELTTRSGKIGSSSTLTVGEGVYTPTDVTSGVISWRTGRDARGTSGGRGQALRLWCDNASGGGDHWRIHVYYGTTTSPSNEVRFQRVSGGATTIATYTSPSAYSLTNPADDLTGQWFTAYITPLQDSSGNWYPSVTVYRYLLPTNLVELVFENVSDPTLTKAAAGGKIGVAIEHDTGAGGTELPWIDDIFIIKRS